MAVPAPTLQLKVSLNWIRPPIWRRFTVPASLTFAQLHDVLQAVLGWTNSHAHEFDVRGKPIHRGYLEYDVDPLPEGSTRLHTIGLNPGTKFKYLYDFGDSWEHTVVLEAVLPAGGGAAGAVRCLKGKRSCPPEDCGGVGGYYRLCEVLANPKQRDPTDEDDEDEEDSDDDDYYYRSRWAGHFTPEAFDIAAVNARLVAVVNRWAAGPSRRRVTASDSDSSSDLD